MRAFLKLIDEAIFKPPAQSRSFLITMILVLILYIIGLLHWITILNYGEITFQAYDWRVFYTFDTVIKEMITEGKIPYHVSRELSPHATNRFFAVPQTNLLPDIFLLRFIPQGMYALLHIIILYSIGFIGCLLIKQRYQLNLFVFSILFALISLNGFVTSRILVGWFSFTSYYFTPVLAYCILKLIESNDKKFSLKASFVLFAILLSGGLHIFVICILFMFLVGLFNLHLFGSILKAVLWSMALTFFRLMPAAMTFWHREHPLQAGFPTLRNLFDGLTDLRIHSFYSGTGIYWHEFDFFIGILGFAFIFFFGIVLRFRGSDKLKERFGHELDFPLIIMGLFSLNWYYAIIAKLPIPLIGVERLPSRFIFILLVFLSIISCVRLQAFLDKRQWSRKAKALSCIAVLHLYVELITHSRWWKISYIEKGFRDVILSPIQIIINTADNAYILAVNLSLVVSLITLGIWFYLFLRREKKES